MDALTITNLSYSYIKGEKTINNISLSVKQGQYVSLLGHNGSGKSTLAKLIDGLLPLDSGKIEVMGLELNEANLTKIRNKVAIVFQNPDNQFIGITVEDDIAFSLENRNVPREEMKQKVVEYAEKVGMKEYLTKEPSYLSGGQKQRVAIADALVINPEILILDEATSALDNKSEKEVQRALDNISQKNVTTIIIAHRLSTIKNADLIYAIKEGKVLEKGTHKELLDKKGYYAGLVKSQLAQDEIETKEEQEKLEHKTTIKRKNTDEEVKFEKDEDIFIEQDKVKIKTSRLFGEISDKKCNMFLACLGAAIVGGLGPANGLMMANAMNGLNSKYETVRYDKGLKYALLFLLVAFLQGLGNTLMNWQFMILGASLVRIYRKKILRKYLQLHLSFFDITINSPGSLLTRLSIDTTQLNSLMLTILGSTVQCSVILVVGLVLGCIYEYRLTLIMFCFVPFIVASMVIRRMLNKGNSGKGVKVNIEAGGVLSECVTNTKTIYSFNFQKKAIEMYMEIIDFLKRQFVRDSLIGGFLSM